MNGIIARLSAFMRTAVNGCAAVDAERVVELDLVGVERFDRVDMVDFKYASTSVDKRGR